MDVVKKVSDVLKTNGFKIAITPENLAPGLCYVDLVRIERDSGVSNLQKRLYVVDVYYGIRELDKKANEVEQIMDAFIVGLNGIVGLTCDFQDKYAKISLEILSFKREV